MPRRPRFQRKPKTVNDVPPEIGRLVTEHMPAIKDGMRAVLSAPRPEDWIVVICETSEGDRLDELDRMIGEHETKGPLVAAREQLRTRGGTAVVTALAGAVRVAEFIRAGRPAFQLQAVRPGFVRVFAWSDVHHVIVQISSRVFALTADA